MKIKVEAMNYIMGYQMGMEVLVQLHWISCTHCDVNQLYQSHHYFGLMNF
jgi:hypothetical protein